MRDDEVYVIRRYARFAEHPPRGLAHAMHGALEDHLTVEIPQRIAERDVAIRVATADAAHA